MLTAADNKDIVLSAVKSAQVVGRVPGLSTIEMRLHTTRTTSASSIYSTTSFRLALAAVFDIVVFEILFPGVFRPTYFSNRSWGKYQHGCVMYGLLLWKHPNKWRFSG